MTRHTLLSQALILGLITGMGVLFALTLGWAAQETIISGAALVLIGLSLLIERFAPHDPDWNDASGEMIGDIGSFVLIFGLLDGVLKWLTPVLLLAVLPDLATGLDWPLWVQIVAVTLLIELGAWVSHWAHHRYGPLWALHAMHHSPERLYTLNNFRFHPLNHLFNHLAMIVPPLALGFSAQAVLAYVALSLPILLLQHTNARFAFGALDGWLNTNTLHRWHHSDDPAEGMTNLGRALVVWDRLFGTHYNPGPGAEPMAIGLFAASRTYPAAGRYLAQLRWPFSPACCR